MAQRPKRAPHRRKLSETVVRALQPGATVWDALLPGFGIRVGKQTRTWIAAVVRPGAKHPVRLKLGTFPQMSLADARQAARQMMAGGAPPPPLMFGELVEVFLRDGRTRTGRPLRPASLRAYRSILKSTAKPLHGRPVHEIRRRDIAALTRKVGAESGPANAALTKAALGRFWSWLAETDQAEANPVAGSPSYQIPKGRRVFSDAEINALWHVEGIADDIALVVKLLLWTGARESEAGGMCWSELKDGIWSLPEQRAKNHRELILPLARQPVAALEVWPRIVGRDPLFGITSRGGFTGWSRAKKQLDIQLRFLRDWQFRDCRRTVETRMASIGIQKEIVNRILNHGVSAMDTTYDHHDYFEEKRAALQLWADKLEQIVRAS